MHEAILTSMRSAYKDFVRGFSKGIMGNVFGVTIYIFVAEGIIVKVVPSERYKIQYIIDIHKVPFMSFVNAFEKFGRIRLISL